MYPVEMNLLSRLLVEERLMEAQLARERRSRRSERPSLYLRMQLWTGERLVRLGNRLKAHYEAAMVQSHVRGHAGLV